MFEAVRDGAVRDLPEARSPHTQRIAEVATLLKAQSLLEERNPEEAIGLLDAAEPRFDRERRHSLVLTRLHALVQAGRFSEAQGLATRLRNEEAPPDLVHVLEEVDRFSWMNPARVAPTPGLLEQVVAQVGASAEAFGMRLWPQPAPGRATLQVTLPEAATAKVEVFDLVGRRVMVLMDGPQAAGAHEVPVEASMLPSGMYLVRLTSGLRVRTERLHIVR